MRIPEGIDPQSFIYGQMNAYAHCDTRKVRREIVDETEAAIRADERERLAKLAEDGDAVMMWRCLPSVPLDPTIKGAITVAAFIRSQGEDK